MRAPENGLHAWHLFPIRIHSEARARRDDVIERLTEKGIEISVHYRPLHQMTYWGRQFPGEAGYFPVADRYFEGALTLTLYPGMGEVEADKVISVMRGALQ